jgi:hypothetical protein
MQATRTGEQSFQGACNTIVCGNRVSMNGTYLGEWLTGRQLMTLLGSGQLGGTDSRLPYSTSRHTRTLTSFSNRIRPTLPSASCGRPDTRTKATLLGVGVPRPLWEPHSVPKMGTRKQTKTGAKKMSTDSRWTFFGLPFCFQKRYPEQEPKQGPWSQGASLAVRSSYDTSSPPSYDPGQRPGLPGAHPNYVAGIPCTCAERQAGICALTSSAYSLHGQRKQHHQQG